MISNLEEVARKLRGMGNLSDVHALALAPRSGVEMLRRYRLRGGARECVRGVDVLRAVYNFNADGRVDTTRSHYTINGRRVSGVEYRRRRRGSR